MSALAVGAYVWIYAAGLASAPARSDAFSYFVFLPAAVVHHDLSLDATARECCGGTYPAWTAIIRWPATGAWVSAHPIGVSVLVLPSYVVAHLLTLWSNFPPDGFSIYYQHAAGLSGVAALVAGLAVLGHALRRWHSRGVTVATLAAITFGTNLFHYGTYDSLYSHVFSFLLICGLIDLVPRWYAAPSFRLATAIGAVSGLVVLVRHPNALYLALIPLFGLGTHRRFREQLHLLSTQRMHVMVMAAMCLLVLAPQLLLYRAATGQWVVSSYGNLWFDFAHPQLHGVLFSVQKGLFFWSPILLLAVAGFFLLAGQAAGFAGPIALLLPATTYIIASWWDWQYGGSYGHRGFTDALGLFAVGLAAAFERVACQPTARRVMIVVATLAAALSIAQMLQYWLGILPISDLTWDQYRDNFLRFSKR